jgi:hypothetical protein
VPVADARFVIDTVYDWLAYLGSALEIELSLLRLKSYVEKNEVLIPDYESALNLIGEYYSAKRTTRNSVSDNPGDEDFMIKIGPFNTSIDVMFIDGMTVSVSSAWVPKRLENKLILEAVTKFPDAGIYQKVIIVFRRGELEEKYQTVMKVPTGKKTKGGKWLYVVYIQLPQAAAT